MSTTPAAPTPRSARLTMAGGGWLLIASMALVAGVVIWSLAGVIAGHRRVGDGATVESYGFDLSNLSVPRSTFVASGLARDGLPPLDQPTVVDGRDVPALNKQLRRKIAVSTDRVLGIAIDGVARAYPLRILNAHEIVNDEIAGVPIAVTYSPLGDAAVVVRRTIAGSERRFGVSGLLDRSNLVLYDRDVPEPSLWSQLAMKAIAGPLAGTPLEPLPGVAITTWADWQSRHPATQIITGDPAQSRRYSSMSYTRYFGNDALPFPIGEPPQDAPGAEGLAAKAPVVALRDPRDPARWMVIPSRRLVQALGRAEEGVVEVDGLALRAAIAFPLTTTEPTGVRLERTDGEPLLTVPALWFVWRAFHPDAAPLPVSRP